MTARPTKAQIAALLDSAPAFGAPIAEWTAWTRTLSDAQYVALAQAAHCACPARLHGRKTELSARVSAPLVAVTILRAAMAHPVTE